MRFIPIQDPTSIGDVMGGHNILYDSSPSTRSTFLTELFDDDAEMVNFFKTSFQQKVLKRAPPWNT